MTKQKRVVFLGKQARFTEISEFGKPFLGMGWEVFVFEAFRIAEKIAPPDLLVVFMDDGLDVKNFRSWEKPPTTIWCYSEVDDEIPDGVTPIRPTHPHGLYQIALKLIGKEE